MSDTVIPINKTTLDRINKIKSDMGLENKSWDEWFEQIFPQKHETDQEFIEKTIRNNAKNLWYEDWIKNFALNLNYIWDGNSARDLFSNENKKSSALVIGRGPSIKKHNHLELLSKSDFNGAIICSDGILPNVLEAGITPDKFNLFVLTIDAQEHQKLFYENPLTQKYGAGIKCILSTTVHPEIFNSATKAKMEIFWLHTLVDYEGDKISFNKIQSIMTKIRNHQKGLPAIQTGANVGTSAWVVAWSILKCTHVGLIGMDNGYDADISWNDINYHGNPFPKDIDQNSESFKKAYPTIYNPDFDCYCKQDPLFVYYANALKEFIFKTKNKVSTINATEGGAIFGAGILCISFKKFLEEYNF